MLQAGRRLSAKLDDLGDIARQAGRRLADDAGDLGRSLRRHGDEFMDSARRVGRRLADDLAGARRALSRHSDELADAARVKRRMETYVNRSDDAIQRRLDEYVSRTDTNIQQRLDDYAGGKIPNPDDNPEDVAAWILRKSQAGEVDDIIDWIRRTDPNAHIDDVAEAQLRKDLRHLGKEYKGSIDGPPSPALRNAMIKSMNANEVTRGGKISARTIPQGSEMYYGRLQPKLGGSKTLLEGPNGLRLLKDKNGRVYFGVSDLDLGVVTTRDGRVLTDREVRKYLVDHRTSSINAFLADELGMEEARVIDHGAHVNFMGGDVDAFGNKLSSQPNAGLYAKGAEWNYVVDAATSTVEKRWLPTFVERLPDAPSNSIVQEFLRNVKDYRGQYHPNLFRKKNG